MIHISNLIVNRGQFSLTIGELVIDGMGTLLMGNNGAGKTTMLLAIAGFLPSTGKIILNSKDINSLSIENRKVSIVTSSLNLFRNKTVKENLLFPKRRREDLLDDVAGDLGILDIMDRKAGELSLGESQRVAVARCLVSQAELMLFDEPFSFQDQINKMNVRNAIEKYAGKHGISYIVSSNIYGEFLYNFDNIISLDHGKIIEIAKSLNDIKHFRTASFVSPMNLIKIGGDYYRIMEENVIFGDDGYEYEEISNGIFKIKIDNQYFYLKIDRNPDGRRVNFKEPIKLEY